MYPARTENSPPPTSCPDDPKDCSRGGGVLAQFCGGGARAAVAGGGPAAVGGGEAGSVCGGDGVAGGQRGTGRHVSGHPAVTLKNSDPHQAPHDGDCGVRVVVEQII